MIFLKHRFQKVVLLEGKLIMFLDHPRLVKITNNLAKDIIQWNFS